MLCIRDHEIAPYAPHENNKRFLEKLIDKLPDGEKRNKILRYIGGLKPIKTIFPGYKTLVMQFKAEIDKIKDDSWMDDGIEGIYSGRDKDGVPQYRSMT